MKNLLLPEIDRFRDRSNRVVEHYGNVGDHTCGVFNIPSPIDGGNLHIVASSEQWDHVSVSRANRCPNWTELEYVKRLMFKDDECAMQLHVPTKNHISLHPYCLPRSGRQSRCHPNGWSPDAAH